MKLFKLSRKGKCGYDEAVSFVIAAHDEQDARLLAQANGGDECMDYETYTRTSPFWTDESKTNCECLANECLIQSETIICENFRHG